MIVSMWMTWEVVTVEPGTLIIDAAALLAAKCIRRLPVVEGHPAGPCLVGIVSATDLDRAFPGRIDQQLFERAVSVQGGAEEVHDLELGDEAVVVTVFPDDNKKYLSTDLLRDEPARPEHLSPGVTLLGVRALRRACRTCRSETEQKLAALREGPG